MVAQLVVVADTVQVVVARVDYRSVVVLAVASDDLVQALVGVDRLDCSLVLGVLDYFVVAHKQ